MLLRNAAQLLPTLGVQDPQLAAELDRIGGVATTRDELWQSMLREEITERDYWVRRADSLGAAVNEHWDVRAMIDRLYDAPSDVWLSADALALMQDTRAAGLPLVALTNDLAAFHGGDWAAEQDVFRLFDTIVDGSLTGILKPDPKAYVPALEAIGLPAGEVVFIDWRWAPTSPRTPSVLVPPTPRGCAGSSRPSRRGLGGLCRPHQPRPAAHRRQVAWGSPCCLIRRRICCTAACSTWMLAGMSVSTEQRR